MIKTPLILASIAAWSVSARPISVADAPNATKTITNPATKAAAEKISRRRTPARTCVPTASSYETPARNDKYAGTRGKMQGEMKLAIPAPNALV